MRTLRPSAFAILAFLWLPACGKESAPPGAGSSSGAPAAGAASAWALAAEPAGAVDVVAAKAQGAAKEVVVVGRVKDTLPGLAAFTLTDLSLAYCGADGKEDGCPTPWDYCCISDDKVAAATIPVAVRVKGEVVAAALPELRNLDLVVVRGALVKAEDGTLRLEADGWHRRERPTLPASIAFPK